jgi:hypothetical protein
VETLGLAYIWLSQTDINANKACKIIKNRCNDIRVERQNVFSNIIERIYLVFYREMKRKWGKESYVDECTRKGIMGIAWPEAGIRKLRGIRRGFERGWWSICLGQEDAKHVQVKCSEKKRSREEFVWSKWLSVNEDITYKTIINWTN